VERCPAVGGDVARGVHVLRLCRAAADGSTAAAAAAAADALDAADADFGLGRGRGRGRPSGLSAPTDPAAQTTSS